MLSVSQRLASRFTLEEIENIIATRLDKFNPVATTSTKVNGSIGCACNTLVNDDVCPIVVDETFTQVDALPVWTVSAGDHSENYKYETIPLRS